MAAPDDILADIAQLEERVADLLRELPHDLAPTHRRLRRSAAEAVLGLLDQFDLDTLKDLDMEHIVEEALGSTFTDWEAGMSQAIAQRVQELVRETGAFYEGRAVELDSVLEAVQRSEAAGRLTRFLGEGMSLSRANLQEATIEAMRDAVARGEIDRDELTRDIAKAADVSAGLANTQATTSVAAYNQEYRNTLADEAGLSHYFYYGSLAAGSRPFCRACAGKTFTEQQVDQMDNGMLSPVKTFRGGWNCRHSWLPVDPAWDEGLADGLVDLDQTQSVILDEQGKRSIQVFLNQAQAGRLSEQAALARVGYDQFFDAEASDRGYVALHPSWRELRHTEKLDGAAYRNLAGEFDVASVLAERGDLIQLNPRVKNKRGGPSDLIWSGLVYEVKTPKTTGSRVRHQQVLSEVSWSQNERFLINLHEAVDDWPRARGRIEQWVRDHPGGRIDVLYRYNNDELESYHGQD